MNWKKAYCWKIMSWRYIDKLFCNDLDVSFCDFSSFCPLCCIARLASSSLVKFHIVHTIKNVSPYLVYWNCGVLLLGLSSWWIQWWFTLHVPTKQKKEIRAVVCQGNCCQDLNGLLIAKVRKDSLSKCRMAIISKIWKGNCQDVRWLLVVRIEMAVCQEVKIAVCQNLKNPVVCQSWEGSRCQDLK